MKLVFVIPTLGSGGAERVLSSLTNDWVERKNCEIEIITLMKGEDFYSINNAVKIHRLSYSSNGVFKIFNMISLFWKLRKLIKVLKPDVTISFIRASNIFTLLSIAGLKMKLVISERDSPDTHLSTVYKFLRKKLYPYSDGIIVQTKEYEKFILKEVGHINCKVIPNPVRNISNKNIEREKIIISVGRLIPVKGHAYLIEAFSKCKNKNNWKLIILGDGVLKNDLIKRTKDLGVENQVEFMGATPKVDYWLCKSSIFAFTSLSEGFPNALAEGMSASLPCVSFNCKTGPEDLIKDNFSGYLVKVGDVENFSLKLENLMADSTLRSYLGENAKEVSNTLKFSEISDKYYNFILEVMHADPKKCKLIN
ncbi:glycosyltransferase family 4 protein [Acinetobacter variabilis]|uniref:glycosyltransferase family 4 protein n=1 Tax=Acinetobacter variabilis TaxID=70346 RepID=UPI003AF7070A